MGKEINGFGNFSSKVKELLPTYHQDKIRENVGLFDRRDSGEKDFNWFF